MSTEKVRDMLGASADDPKYVWMSGDLVEWDAAVVHASTLGWSAISMVFEGIRGYWNAEKEQLNIFHLDLHIERLIRSMKVMRMTSPWSVAELKRAIVDLVQANEFRDDIYVQPLAYFGGSTTPGYLPVSERPGDITIFNRQIGSVLGSGNTMSCGVSSWTRISDNVMPPRVKAIANYQNSRYVADESSRHGYDFGIILNPQGKVSEISYACLYIVRDGVAITPPVSAGILESITRDVVKQLFQNELGITVIERDIDRTELYIADEVFICGTGAELQAVNTIDGYKIGNGAIGPAVTQIEQLFHDIVRGKDTRHPEWRTGVY